MTLTFEEVWELADLGIMLKVSNGQPPQGAPGSQLRNVWLSHNFTGNLEEKIEEDGWRYLKIATPDDPATVEVEYRAYTVADGGGHSFEVLND